MAKTNLDPEIKVEVLIKLAFGIPIQSLCEEYSLTKEKITNLRKNNYKLYNSFFDYWRIDKSIATLGLESKPERALNILKKYYKDKITIVSLTDVTYKDKKLSLEEIIDLVDTILKKDNITIFKTQRFFKNFY